MLPLGSRPQNSTHYNGIMDIVKRVGINIRKIRNKKGWSQEKLSFAANLHRAYIGQIERGEKAIGIKNLEIIANALSVNITEFLK
jgi:transcriptional regulator with XRE-family HTH domain